MYINCPECNGEIRRSRVHGFGERLARGLTRLRPYRCRECGWRGWSSDTRRPLRNWRSTLRTIISALVMIFLALLIFYMTFPN